MAGESASDVLAFLSRTKDVLAAKVEAELKVSDFFFLLLFLKKDA